MIGNDDYLFTLLGVLAGIVGTVVTFLVLVISWSRPPKNPPKQ